jgi:hypothetical protein
MAGAKLLNMVGMVDQKDVVLAVVGASAGLAGFVLVFLGLVVGAYGGLAGDTPPAVRRPLRRTAWWVLASFSLGILALAAGIWWLIDGGSSHLGYVVTCTLFWVQLVTLIASASWTLRELLWD